jgi:DNA-binding transcriptional LysR family regulator
MELHQLRCFIAAAEQLHFGRAAQQLQMLPSALGRHVRLLEEDLGTRLFARTTRVVSLTDDGASSPSRTVSGPDPARSPRAG